MWFVAFVTRRGETMMAFSTPRRFLMPHVVLLGDSSIDNAAYVGHNGVPVVGHLRARLPAGWKVSQCALDGSTTEDIDKQLAKTPEDATHLVVSVGGNNALLRSDVLREKSRSVAESLMRFHELSAAFEREYCDMLEEVLARGLPTGVCAIYDPAPVDELERKVMRIGLQTFNDVIFRAAFARGVPVVDLRLTCNDAKDLANPIEPSSIGGAKIADGIAWMVTEHDFTRRRSTVYVGSSRA
jgi:hypothetical protein